MSQAANLIAFDGASTPVSHTLVPVSVAKTNGKLEVVYREKLTAVPEIAQVYAIVTQETTKAGTVITTTDVRVPVMESVSGVNASGYTAAPKVAYEDRNMHTNFAHPRSTVTSRRLARQLMVNICDGVLGTVTPNTSGPVPEAIDLLTMPT